MVMSLAQVVKLTCDCSGLTIGNYKGFPWQASGGKAALPAPAWCTASALQSGDKTVKNSGPLGSHSEYICIPGPGGFIPLSLNWGLKQRSPSGTSAEASLSNEEEILKTFPHSGSVPSTFLLLALSSLASAFPWSFKL